MATALNMTLPIKQDAATQKALRELEAVFGTRVQPAIDEALRKSGIVHFARVLVIRKDNTDKNSPGLYIQVITEFDGDKKVYTEFFRRALPDVFKAIFALADGAPAWEELNTADSFYEYSRTANVRALGGDPADVHEGWLFSAYGNREVKEILPKLGG